MMEGLCCKRAYGRYYEQGRMNEMAGKKLFGLDKPRRNRWAAPAIYRERSAPRQQGNSALRSNRLLFNPAICISSSGQMWGKGNTGNIDSLVNDQNELDARADPPDEAEGAGGQRVLVGKVEHFFSKIDVAAVVLTGHLRVGDMIEIVKGDARARQKVSSMQIEKQDVSEAREGDDVGIKVDSPVAEGSLVYVVEEE